ncbi:MAG: IS21-like element helper ATPase IstB [Myxococcales bacterium]|nr:IS21-like element helper ATPase IstB [Myxococcales bacterium]
MTPDLDVHLKRLHLANARRVWRELVVRAEKEQWSHGQLLETLFAEEVAHRRGTRLFRAVRYAAFPFLRTVEEFDFTHQSTLRLTTIGSLLAPDFVTEGSSVILAGRPGRGKTHLAIAIAYRAIQNGFEAMFTTAAELIEDLSTAGREGRMREALAHYLKPHVLVVDEVGYLAYGTDAANVLYHVVNDRHIRKRSMIFTTNKHPKRWGEALHDEDLAEAIVDRILERGRLLRLDGPSIRTKHLPGDDLVADDSGDSTGSKVSGTRAAEFPERTSATSSSRIHTRGSTPRQVLQRGCPMSASMSSSPTPRPSTRGRARSTRRTSDRRRSSRSWSCSTARRRHW